MLSKSYLAGLFDGEGCVFIQRYTGRGGRVPYYNMRATVNMIHRPLIEMLAEQLDASIMVHRKDLINSKHRPSFEVCLNNARAREFLEWIFDELIVKKEEARLAILFQHNMNLYRGRLHLLSDEQAQRVTEYREALRLRVKELKRTSLMGATDWNAGELGENPMPDLFGDAEGQSRTKQELTTPGVCNEQVPASKEKVCSELGRNAESAAEMTAPNKLRLVG